MVSGSGCIFFPPSLKRQRFLWLLPTCPSKISNPTADCKISEVYCMEDLVYWVLKMLYNTVVTLNAQLYLFYLKMSHGKLESLRSFPEALTYNTTKIFSENLCLVEILSCSISWRSFPRCLLWYGGDPGSLLELSLISTVQALKKRVGHGVKVSWWKAHLMRVPMFQSPRGKVRSWSYCLG